MLTTSFASGADVKTVQARLRHASAKTTLDTYGHIWPDRDESPAPPSSRSSLPGRNSGGTALRQTSNGAGQDPFSGQTS